MSDLLTVSDVASRMKTTPSALRVALSHQARRRALKLDLLFFRVGRQWRTTERLWREWCERLEASRPAVLGSRVARLADQVARDVLSRAASRRQKEAQPGARPGVAVTAEEASASGAGASTRTRRAW